MAEIEHPHLAVMFTDIKDYGRMMSEDESAALGVLAEHNQIMESVIGAHGGRVVKKLGDSYMVIFQQADAAVKCGLHALTKIAARNRKSARPVEIRVGIHEGSMLEREGDFFGETVNIAARLEQMAGAMTAAVSERVLQEVATRVKCEARFVGAQRLKNLRYPLSVYQLTQAEAWKLYLSPDGQATDESDRDVLSEIATAPEAWARVEQLVRDGVLEEAVRLGEAALSRFGGAYADYARLAAVYLIVRLGTEAQSVLRMGELLGQHSEEDEQRFGWIETLAKTPDEVLRASPAELARCLNAAQKYVGEHPDELSLVVLFEGTKARLTGHVGGLMSLAQRYADAPVALRSCAEALKDAGRDAEALSNLDQAVAAAPHVADHQLRRVQWMVEGEDLEAVLAESAGLAQRFPKDGRVYEWTGKTRLLALDPYGAQWIFEQRRESGMRAADSGQWHICSLMHQGRFDKAVEAARRELRAAIRQDRRRMARTYLKLATVGTSLGRWDGVLETFEEYGRYDADQPIAQAGLIAARFERSLLRWAAAVEQLKEAAAARDMLRHAEPRTPGSENLGHPFKLMIGPMLSAVQDVGQWRAVHELELCGRWRDWIMEKRDVDAAAVEARGALRFGAVEEWHGQLVPLLSQLVGRLHPCMPALLALAGLIQARLGNLDAGRGHLEQARKMWASADWPVWEIQEAEATLSRKC